MYNLLSHFRIGLLLFLYLVNVYYFTTRSLQVVFPSARYANGVFILHLPEILIFVYLISCP